MKVDWTTFSYWTQLVEELKSWLLRFDLHLPFHANQLVHIIIIFLAARLALWLAFIAVNIIVMFAYGALFFIASMGARWLIYSLISEMAEVYVSVEVFMIRIMSPLVDTIIDFDAEDPVMEHEDEEIKGFVERERLGLLSSIARAIVMYLLIFPIAFTFAFLSGLPRNLTRITTLNIASLIATLWLSGLLGKLSNIVARFPLSGITLSTLAASGTLVALIFVSLNSDVRGKAELNKVASLACRKALHESTPKFLRIADALETIRFRASKRLRAFPTDPELFAITGRNDLHWHGSGLLPLGMDPRFSSVSPAFADWSTRKPRRKRRSILVRRDVMKERSVLKSQSKEITRILEELDESGLSGKFTRVLNCPARTYFKYFWSQQFRLDIGTVVHDRAGDSGHDYIFEEEGLSESKDIWVELADANFNDPNLNRQCTILSRTLRSVIYDRRVACWRMALDEYRLRYLAKNIDSSLRPSLPDRIRQLFDK